MSRHPKTPSQWLRSGQKPLSATLRHYAQFAAQLSHWQQLFQQCVDKNTNQHCQLLNIRDGQMIIHVDNGSWATRLKLQQAAIITHFRHNATVPVHSLSIKVSPSMNSFEKSIKNQKDSNSADRLLAMAEGCDEPLKSELKALAAKFTANDND
ncbi:DUF721 domain-containing protein [Idiomarina sp. HP20-50]|uniref:DUF721 domain-containing protein n=1 Tax=Idiomarina sp. HP20-50 TaxID=3070813 RepID=UPI00294AE185|nr:DciA family protein [Idiomarina sp. HP20-50]MDV6316015.1 DciA family protein [Idiomarina sp. HP20-50]